MSTKESADEKQTEEIQGCSTKSSNNGLAERLAKLQQLKKKKQESDKQNKQELFKDYKQQKLKSIEYKQLEKKKINAELEHEKLSSLEKGEDFERKQNWDWSIEDCEKWEKKNKNKAKMLVRGFQNFNQMAEQSYNKEIRNLNIDKEAYDRQKKENDAANSSADKKSILPIPSNPSKADVNTLVRNIEEANSRRMKRRRNKDDENDVSSYINDKNKQFNLKLNRQYDES